MGSDVRKPHLYSLDGGNEWQSIAELYLKATTRPKRFDNALIVKSRPFACTLVLVKEKAKGRRAFNANGSRQRDTNSLPPSSEYKCGFRTRPTIGHLNACTSRNHGDL